MAFFTGFALACGLISSAEHLQELRQLRSSPLPVSAPGDVIIIGNGSMAAEETTVPLSSPSSSSLTKVEAGM
jgi:hypothetical protein